ncbi:hypothetical protein EV643_101522 [Kribbella sp. VKM Ac-2527]|uniref:Uncharacterized protein n=1 Tax=Kribbella caucasensis TaxID=2512215 RepID=A0A4R6KQ04_9ACTN|nr:hypothetical protein [Kribbella sp. VKM Ac-2527]TDO54732.1 hypothetical protein EV643_101522 [Kribbella sp. VKM Ac-2527]
MIIAVDANSRDAVEAEHLLHELLSPLPGSVSMPVVACTHVVSGGDRPHLAVSISSTTDLSDHVRTWCADRAVGSAITHPGASEPELAGPSELVRGAYLAAVECALGTTGRLVRWPGREQAQGILTAAELRDRCGIDDVEALGNLPVEDDSRIDTRDFVRPIRRAGRVVLQVQPAAGGVLIPFEPEHQQKCCADH